LNQDNVRACAKCGTLTDDFAKNQKYCRPCKRQYMREYKEHNRDRLNANKRADHARNAERRRAQQREYRERKKAEKGVMPSTTTT
jgi:hypothetical protein